MNGTMKRILVISEKLIPSIKGYQELSELSHKLNYNDDLNDHLKEFKEKSSSTIRALVGELISESYLYMALTTPYKDEDLELQDESDQRKKG